MYTVLWSLILIDVSSVEFAYRIYLTSTFKELSTFNYLKNFIFSLSKTAIVLVIDRIEIKLGSLL